ncbi:MAG: ParA family protein, partial [Planctomycetota bacterium]
MSTRSYALWNNKGGVGKSTITFHLATRYAERHPDTRVLVIDLCPQANSSMMLLGGGENGEKITFAISQASATPKTVAGYIAEVLTRGEGGATPDPASFVTRCADHNARVPGNIDLLCGDGNLEPMAPLISQRALQEALTEGSSPWKWVHQIMRGFINSVESLESPVVVFIDTNPSFSVYTEIAITAADELLVPINADDASRVATNAMFSLIYGANPPHPIYGKYTYAARADTHGLPKPLVKLVIGNRLTQYDGAAGAFG